MEKVNVIEFWQKIPPSIMAFKNLDRRQEAVETMLKRIDPELKFQRMDGNICLAIKVSQ